MKARHLACGVAVVLFSLVATLQAQPIFPLRAKTDTLCTLCPGTSANLPTTGWGNPDASAPATAWPLSKFIGRWCDASFTRDHQGSFRTARAYDVKFSPDGKRVYILLGNAVAAYDASSFFSRQESGEAMVSSASAPMIYPNSRFGPYEYYLSWERFFHADYTTSGWNCPLTDGQDRLIDFDVDDQGRVYMAYSKFGWGIVKDDGGSGGNTLMSSLVQDFNITNVWGLPTKVMALKGSTGYYALIQSAGNPQTKVYKIVNALAPDEQAPLTIAPAAWAKSSDRVAVITPDQTRLLIYDVDDFVTGARNPLPSGSVTAPSGGSWGAVTSDGSNFYAVSSAPLSNAGTISIFTASSTSHAASFTQSTLAMNEVFLGLTGKSGSGFVSFTGFSGQARVARLYKIAGGTLVPFDLKNSLTNYYGGAVPAGYIAPQYGTIFTVHPWRVGSRLFLVVAANGLGDTYELNDVGALAASTTLPYSGSYFYGDNVAFLASTASVSDRKPLTWNFGSPNSFDTGDTAGYTNEAKYHRYFGLSTSQIPSVLTVTATLNDGSASAQTSVTLKKPHARFIYPVHDAGGIRYLTAQPNATATPVLMYGDTFTDASDGDDGGHFLEWVVGTFGDAAAAVNRYFTAHSDAQSVGDCGARTLSFTAHYGPFTTPLSAGSISNPDFAVSMDPASDGGTKFNYTVKAIVSGITYTASPYGLTFTSASYGSPNLSGSNIGYRWELVDEAGVTRYTGPNSISGTDLKVAGLGAVPQWSFTYLQGGSSVSIAGLSARLTIQSDAAMAGCASSDSVSIGKPLTAALTGSCSTGCSFAITSPNDEATSGHWTYNWTATNASTGAVVSVTQAANGSTFAPIFTQDGDYYVTATVSNEFGSVSRQSATYTVHAAATCPLNVGSNIFLNDPQCANGTCTFSVGFWPAPPSCPITYVWTVDGTPIAGSDSTISYNSASLSQGSHNVGCTATVTGTSTTANLGTKTFSVGSTSTCTLSPGSNIFLNEPSCASGNCTFSVGFWPSAPACSISYSWTVDGSAVAGSGASISYNTGSLANGTHTVGCSATVSGTTTPVSLGTKTFTVGSSTGGSCSLSPGNNIFLNNPSGCESGNCSFSVGFWPSAPACTITYTWRIDGSVVAGTDSVLNYNTGSLSAGSHNVSCAATPAGGATVDLGSKPFTVAGQTCPTLVANQNVVLNQPACYDGTCNFAVTAPAACNLAYTWKIDGNTVSGASGATYSTSLAAGTHNVAVSVNGTAIALGPLTFTVTGSTASCTLVKGANIFMDNQVCTSTACTFSVSTFQLSTACALSYSWKIDGNAVAGTDARLTYTQGLASGSHTVACTVTSGASSVLLDLTFNLSSSVGAGVTPVVNINYQTPVIATATHFTPVVGPAEFVPQKFTWTATDSTGKTVGQAVKTTSAAFEMTFATAGRYTVSLTVDGTSTSGSKSVSFDVVLPRRRSSRR